MKKMLKRYKQVSTSLIIYFFISASFFGINAFAMPVAPNQAVTDGALGEKKVLMLFVRTGVFDYEPLEDKKIIEAKTAMKKANDLFMKNSYGKMWLGGNDLENDDEWFIGPEGNGKETIKSEYADISGWYNLSGCGGNKIITNAETRIFLEALINYHNHNYDITNPSYESFLERVKEIGFGHIVKKYRFITIYIEDYGNCISNKSGGLGAISGKSSWIGSLSAKIIVHEMSHNLGLKHANFLDCGSDIDEKTDSSSLCTSIEYGNIFDIMGVRSFEDDTNAYNKKTLGWINDSNVKDLRTVVLPGTYTLKPMEDQEISDSSFKAIVLPRNEGEYWLEYKRKSEELIIYSAFNNITNILTMNPDNFTPSADSNDLISTSNFTNIDNIGLYPGKTFITPNNIIISPISMNDSEMKVRIDILENGNNTKAQISSPSHGDFFRASDNKITISGTASGGNEFQLFFAQEKSPLGWIPITDKITSLEIDGVLGTFNIQNINTGTYYLKLEVTDTSGFIASDSVKVYIENKKYTTITPKNVFINNYSIFNDIIVWVYDNATASSLINRFATASGIIIPKANQIMTYDLISEEEDTLIVWNGHYGSGQNGIYPSISESLVVWSNENKIIVCENFRKRKIFFGGNECDEKETIFYTPLTTYLPPHVSISENSIVWDDGNAQNGTNINMCEYDSDTKTCQQQLISSNSNIKSRPIIHNNLILWGEESRNMGPILYLYDISSREQLKITKNQLSQDIKRSEILNFAINGNRVVWIENNNHTNSIYSCVYDSLATECTNKKILTNNIHFPAGVTVSGDWAAWANKGDIVLYDFINDKQYQVTVKPGSQENPIISNGRLIWNDKVNDTLKTLNINDFMNAKTVAPEYDFVERSKIFITDDGTKIFADFGDYDNDGIDNYTEMLLLGTSPDNIDTDGDGYYDVFDDSPLNFNLGLVMPQNICAYETVFLYSDMYLGFDEPYAYQCNVNFLSSKSIFAGENFTVESGYSVTFEAREAIFLEPGFEAKYGSEFYVRINKDLVEIQ